jgi:hypothetical protein
MGVCDGMSPSKIFDIKYWRDLEHPITLKKIPPKKGCIQAMQSQDSINSMESNQQSRKE